MIPDSFAAGVRRATNTISRRGSLLMAAGAVLAAAATSQAGAAAGKTGSKAKQRCRRQREQCRAFFVDLCASLPDPQQCEALHLPCCDPFARCNAGPAVACLLPLE